VIGLEHGPPHALRAVEKVRIERRITREMSAVLAFGALAANAARRSDRDLHVQAA